MRFLKRLWLRLKLRAKLRWYRLVPLVAVAWAALEVRALAAQLPVTGDSLLTTLLVRQVVGPWNGGTPMRAFCITWHAEKADRPRVLVLIDAAVADTTVHPLCPDPLGGFYPVLIDAPLCPPDSGVTVTDREFVLVRCDAGGMARYKRAADGKRAND